MPSKFEKIFRRSSLEQIGSELPKLARRGFK